MKKNSSKDFKAIHDDYCFFQAYSDEAVGDREKHALCIAPRLCNQDNPTLLDFGCGDGSFTGPLLRQIGTVARQCNLTLFDPNKDYRDTARPALAALLGRDVAVCDTYPQALAGRYDVILANHSFYYVEDLEQTVADLRSSLKETGVLLVSMAGKSNALERYTIEAFARLGKASPYWIADDLFTILQTRRIASRWSKVHYTLRFPDHPANRLHLAHFLIGEAFFDLPRDWCLAPFDRFSDGAYVTMTLEHDHIVVGQLP